MALQLERYSALFWDFDGVIKDSVSVKSDAYERLFAPFGAQLSARVRAHHELNGGMSRFEKLPLYMHWAGLEASVGTVSKYCGLFSTAVRQAVIDSSWVPGAREYLQRNHARQWFYLITGTPQEEIEDIVSALGIAGFFREVHGAPMPKSEAIESALARAACARRDALVIGDSTTDYEAAKAASVEFLLRRTALNRQLQRLHSGLQCEDFLNE
jgi:phosphoglycolate phosphatase-like HAD superfamily hydrolase